MVQREFLHLATATHRCYVGVAGVTVYCTDTLGENEEPLQEQLMLFSPTEALQIAEYVLEYRTELESREAALETVFEQVSQAVLTCFFSKTWQQDLLERRTLTRRIVTYVPNGPDAMDEIRRVYRSLLRQDASVVHHWSRDSWVDCYSHEQQETLFWRYFHTRYFSQVLEKFLSEEEQV